MLHYNNSNYLKFGEGESDEIPCNQKACHIKNRLNEDVYKRQTFTLFQRRFNKMLNKREALLEKQ